MYYGNIKDYDVANGLGVRVTLFVSGCRNHCEGCFQPETWDFQYGKLFTQETEDELLKMLEPDYIAGFTCLGGSRLSRKIRRSWSDCSEISSRRTRKRRSGAIRDTGTARIWLRAEASLRMSQRRCLDILMFWLTESLNWNRRTSHCIFAEAGTRGC